MANSSGRGDSGTILWAAAAVVVVGVFVWWLSITAEPSVTPLLMEDDTAAAASPGTMSVTAAQFEPNANGFRGQVVELTDVPVVQHMGSSMFWVELPSGNPLLVRASAEAMTGGLPEPQSRVTVVGTVREKTAQVLDAWQQEGILGANQRQDAQFGDNYIEATAIRPAG